jgi:hypothetical protein
MPQGGFRGAEELGTGTRSGDKPTKRKPLRADATLYRPSKGGFTGFDGDKTTYGLPEVVGDPSGLSKAQNDEINAAARRSEQMAAQIAQAAAIGGNVGTRANRLVNAGPSTPPIGPLQEESTAARDRIRMQIANEQRALLDARRAGKMVKGSEQDATSLANIAALRREYEGYSQAARPTQRPSSPENNFFASREASNQAAKIMQGDLAAMEQRVYTMPPGSAKDAELEKVRAFKSKTNEQFVRGNVLRPEDTGPAVPGSSPTGYYDALAEADKQTGSQVAAAGRDYDRRQNVLGFTKDITAKRLAEEQRTKDMTSAIYNAGMAGIRRPEDEFKMRQDAVTTEMRARETAIKDAERVANREDSLSEAKVAAAKWDMDPTNPKNREASAKANVLDAQAMREMSKYKQGGPATKEEMETAMIGREFNTQQVGLTPQLEATAMQAATALASEMGGIGNDQYIGSMFTGNAEGGIKATAQMASFAQALDDLAKVDPQAAKNKARDFLASMPKRAAGTSQHAGGTGANTALMLGGVAAAPFTFGISLLGTLAGAIQQGQQFYNASDKAKVVADLNRTRDILERLSQ